jgi:hypothetical protein
MKAKNATLAMTTIEQVVEKEFTRQQQTTLISHLLQSK